MDEPVRGTVKGSPNKEENEGVGDGAQVSAGVTKFLPHGARSVKLLRTLVDCGEYSNQLNALGKAFGGVKRIDEALESLAWALPRRPEDWPVIPGTRALRVAKTDRHPWAEGTVPRLRVYFTIPNDYQVHLKSIEVDPEEDSWV